MTDLHRIQAAVSTAFFAQLANVTHVPHEMLHVDPSFIVIARYYIGRVGDASADLRADSRRGGDVHSADFIHFFRCLATHLPHATVQGVFADRMIKIVDSLAQLIRRYGISYDFRKIMEQQWHDVKRHVSEAIYALPRYEADRILRCVEDSSPRRRRSPPRTRSRSPTSPRRRRSSPAKTRRKRTPSPGERSSSPSS